MQDQKLLNNILVANYKYYLNVDWFPVVSVCAERYNICNSGANQPDIVKFHADGHIYEVNDPYLFYCTEIGAYEYYVYYVMDIFRVTKFRPVGSTNNFRTCVKSSVLRGHYMLENLTTNNAISSSSLKHFNVTLYNEIRLPVFINRPNKGSVICDLNSDDQGNIILSLADSCCFIKVGRTNISFHCKVDTLFGFDKIELHIFDIYKLGNILRKPFDDRYEYINIVLAQSFDKYVTVAAAKKVNVFADELREIIIADNDNVNYTLWRSSPTIVGRLSGNSILLRDGTIEGFTNNISNATMVALNLKSKEITPEYNYMNLDKYSLYRQLSNSDSTSIDILQRTNYKASLNFNKRNFVKLYASGRVLIMSPHFQYMNDIIYDEIKEISSNPAERKIQLAKYHTVIYDEMPVVSDHKDQKVLLISNNMNEWNVKDAGEKTFVFLLGPIGSGKSSSIKTIRSMINSSGIMFVAQIDKLVESDIEYITNPCEETYLELRKKIYNGIVDKQLDDAILKSHSIILETTRIDPDYIKMLKENSYKVVFVIIDESFEVVTNNIRIRNMSKVRKTNLTLEKYNSLYEHIEKYKSYADAVISLRPSE